MPELGAPGVKIEEISSGPRPVSMSGTTDTGFVGLVTIPEDFFLGKLRLPGQVPDGWRPLMPLPRPSLVDPAASWQAALAFLPFAKPQDRKEAAPNLFYRINGQPRERKDVDALLKAHTGGKLYAVREGTRDEKDVTDGVRAIRDRLNTPGEYHLEVKPGGDVFAITVAEEPRAEDIAQNIRLVDLVREALGDEWDILTSAGPDHVEASLRDRADSRGARAMQVRFRRALLTLRRLEDTGREEWVLAPRSDGAQAVELKNQVLEVLSSEAVAQGIPFRGDLARMVDDATQEQRLQIRALQELMMVPARAATSIDSFETWQREFAEELFVNLLQVMNQTKRKQAETLWKQLREEHQAAWVRWVRYLPGMLQAELSVRGFFTNGGRVAFLSMAVQGDQTGGPDRYQFLRASFDSLSSMAIICAPGLDKGWQEALLNYAGPNGRGDLFAVLETPRYLLTRSDDEGRLGRDRWMKAANGYEQPVLEFRDTTEELELRYSGYANDELLSNAIPRDERGFGAAYGPWLIVDNPRSISANDRYVVAPPSGHIAGMIAATDLKPGSGVHKAPANEPMAGIHSLVTTVSDNEQAALNARGINIIRRRPFAGIRCWGARTTASDPLWRYVNVRRLFLMVERSLRDAIQWAVFLPNNDTTRGDLRSTIMAFLYRLHSQGALEGRQPSEAYKVRCDRENNPDPDVRDGILTVDVEMRPVYPAEFIRLRFRQSPMQLSMAEGR